MDYHVCLEVTSYFAGEVALCASKGLLSTMNKHVSFQISSTDARVATLIATEWLLSIVLKHVQFKVFGHLEGVIALNTQERGVFCLDFHCRILVQLVLLSINI